MLVLDSSATLAWLLDDERSAIRTLEALETERVTVPAHWILEVTNGLRMAVRRRRLVPGDRAPILRRLAVLPIRVDVETAAHGWHAIPELADRYELTTYDAAYLELALRLELPLATLDQDLARAARAAGVTLFE